MTAGGIMATRCSTPQRLSSTTPVHSHSARSCGSISLTVAARSTFPWHAPGAVGEAFRSERQVFYLNMLRLPFSLARGGRAVFLAALLAMSQAAHAAGFLWEGLRHRRLPL